MAKVWMMAAALVGVLLSPAWGQEYQASFAQALDAARALGRVESLIIARDGEVAVAEHLLGGDLDDPVNIKSLSKVVISALVGIAIDKEELDGVDQRLVDLLPKAAERNDDSRIEAITLDNLLSMRAGLAGTSNANYGAWVASRNWVDFALARDFIDAPGGRMIYSTGNTHLLSAILTEATGRSTRDLAEAWLLDPLGARIGGWDRDPQGIYLGGNNLALSPRAVLALGELYRNDGMHEGAQVLSPEWIAASWTPQQRSRLSGEYYGYGWFLTEMAGYNVRYGWGFGGQMLYVVKDLGLTVVMTADPTQPSAGDGYVRRLHGLVETEIIPAAEAARAAQ